MAADGKLGIPTSSIVQKLAMNTICSVTVFHVSSSLNRESIESHGLDWTLMGVAPGIAGGRVPEVEGCFLAIDEFEADRFIRMNNTGGPVDLWAVEGIDTHQLLESPSGYRYFPARIPNNRLTLIRTNIAPTPRFGRT